MKIGRLFFGILLGMILILGACSTSTDNNVKKDKTENSSNTPKKENNEKLKLVNIHDYDFTKNENDLKKTITFSKSKIKKNTTDTTNAYINQNTSIYSRGEHSLLIDDHLLVSDVGEGKFVEIPIESSGVYTDNPLYNKGLYYVPYKEGIYTIDEKNRKTKQVFKEPIHRIEMDDQNFYYITNTEGKRDYSLHTMGINDMKEKWSTEKSKDGFAGAGMTDIHLMDDMILYKTKDYLKALDKETGEVIWQTDKGYFTVSDVGDSIFGIVHSGDHTEGEYTLTELDKTNGEIKYSIDLPSTFSLFDQTYPEFASDGKTLFIDLEQSILAYDIADRKLKWALTGKEGFHADEMDKNEDTMDMDVVVRENGTVIASGYINAAPQTDEKMEGFIVKLDPDTGEIKDGYMIENYIERNKSNLHKFDNQFLIINDASDFPSAQKYQSFIGEVE